MEGKLSLCRWSGVGRTDARGECTERAVVTRRHLNFEKRPSTREDRFGGPITPGRRDLRFGTRDDDRKGKVKKLNKHNNNNNNTTEHNNNNNNVPVPDVGMTSAWLSIEPNRNFYFCFRRVRAVGRGDSLRRPRPRLRRKTARQRVRKNKTTTTTDWDHRGRERFAYFVRFIHASRDAHVRSEKNGGRCVPRRSGWRARTRTIFYTCDESANETKREQM